MTYLDPQLRRQDEKVALNDIERGRGKKAAVLAGRTWGELKRELINMGVQKILEEFGEQRSAGSHEG
ncbi:hypothetical protein DyAD56_16000 [Dyella sp. AD56]|uniref:hypothetical protein n=1 Tax=Dyella sp. AD56 TaxID=1528744 RepID=UPI000C825294|nr:hypothetical protein [Dyella sp. AD56]PMQ04191.1 hypothetical protein DyAD56_16000 [Dyella sp. AD56]